MPVYAEKHPVIVFLSRKIFHHSSSAKKKKKKKELIF
jgi:hypothetical protein